MAYFHTTVLDNQIKTLPTYKTASGSVATFETDMTENLISCVCEVASGSNEINLNVCGYNRFNPIVYSSFLQPDGKYNGVANDINFIRTYLGDYVGKQMTFSVYADLTVSPAPTNVRVAVNINGETINGNFINSEGYTSVTFTPQSANDYIFITYGSYSTRSYTFYDIQLEFGATRTNYVPFNSTTINIPFDETLSGDGSFDVLSGILTRSDNTTKQLSANYIQTNNGENNIWCDTGDISAKYILSVGEALRQA